MLHGTTCPDKIGTSGRSGERTDLGKYCVVIVSLILFFAEVQAQSGAWNRKTNVPTPRVAAPASAIDNKIYVFGGSAGPPNYSDLAANEIYDPLTDTWVKRKDMPTPRGWLSTAVVNDTIYAIGGGYPTAKNTVEAYDPATNTWTAKADMLSPRLGVQRQL